MGAVGCGLTVGADCFVTAGGDARSVTSFAVEADVAEEGLVPEALAVAESSVFFLCSDLWTMGVPSGATAFCGGLLVAVEGGETMVTSPSAQARVPHPTTMSPIAMIDR